MAVERMRSGIATKLAGLLAVFAVLASGLTGYYSHVESRTLLIEAAERELLTATQVLGRRLSISLNEVATNVRLLAALPPAHLVAEPGQPPQLPPSVREELANVFSQMLALHPEYFQIRLIGAAGHGRELVRVDREADGFRTLDDPALQEKGHFPYVFKTLQLAPGKIYLSRITINQERGGAMGADQPSLQVATPVHDAAGKVFGLVVINLNLNELFQLLKTDVPADVDLYLTNAWGDFLLHPDASKAFGFARGQRILLQQTWPETVVLFDTLQDSLIVDRPLSAASGPDSQVAAFIRLPFGEIAVDRFLVLGLSRPVAQILDVSRQLSANIISIVFAFSLLAVAVAVLVSRLVTEPLSMMVAAVRHFAAEHVMGELPLKRKDELGLLARTMSDMQADLGQHLAELNESRTHLNHQARHDALTGLPNRLMFFDRLEQAVANARRTGHQLAVVFVDLDRFKQINDTLGHDVGDEVLKAAANLFRTLVRKADTVARLGGDEFIILFDYIEEPQQVSTIAQKIIHRFQRPFRIQDKDLYLHASLGICIFPQDGESAHQLVRHADVAMYKAKHDGRNTFQFYTADMMDRAMERMSMEGQMRESLEKGNFILHYQSQVDLANGELVGVEALLRWQHPERGLLPPASFIPLAEETGLIIPLGERLLYMACHQMAQWQNAGLGHFRVAVNMSDRQLRHKDLLPMVMTTLQKTGCQPDWLEMEATEHFFLEQSNEALVNLDRLCSAGVELSIDGFGTGYSSLSNLRNLPIKKLKIDRSFVRDVLQDANAIAIARAIIALGHSLDLLVIAEGIESEAQQVFFRAEGCDQAQGFLFSEAVSAEDMTLFLAQRRNGSE